MKTNTFNPIEEGGASLSLPAVQRRRWLAGLALSSVGASLATLPAWARAATSGCTASSDWTSFVARHIQADGRVVDFDTPQQQSTSEGQSYGLFFSLVHNDRDTFARVLSWTDANLAGLTLRRDGKDYVIDVDSLNRKDSQLSKIYLKDGDYLHLNSNSKNKIYVLGEVLNPQVISFSTTSVTLLEALGTSGGLSPEAADGEAVYVIRAQDATHSATVYHLNAKKPTAYTLAKGFELAAQDVVFVGPANITRWSRYVSQLLGSNNLVQTGAMFRH